MKRFLYMLTILPVLLFTACEDSGTNNDEVQHFEADGLILTNSGVKYLVYYQGNFTIHEDYGHDGHLEFGLGVSPGHTEVRVVSVCGGTIAQPAWQPFTTPSGLTCEAPTNLQVSTSPLPTRNTRHNVHLGSIRTGG